MFCRQPFVPSPYRPQQLVCSAQECQRRRRAEYHRRKRHADSVYRQVAATVRRNGGMPTRPTRENTERDIPMPLSAIVWLSGDGINAGGSPH